MKLYHGGHRGHGGLQLISLRDLRVFVATLLEFSRRFLMTSRISVLVAGSILVLAAHVHAANTASGSVDVQKVGTISPKFSAGYLVRDQRNARTTETEILLSEVMVDPAAMEGVLDPHMVAINL